LWRKFISTSLKIDEKLVENAVKLGHHRTKKEAVTKALISYINQLEQKNIISMFGVVEYEADYDYKKQREQK